MDFIWKLLVSYILNSVVLFFCGFFFFFANCKIEYLNKLLKRFVNDTLLFLIGSII